LQDRRSCDSRNVSFDTTEAGTKEIIGTPRKCLDLDLDALLFPDQASDEEI